MFEIEQIKLFQGINKYHERANEDLIFVCLFVLNIVVKGTFAPPKALYY